MTWITVKGHTKKRFASLQESGSIVRTSASWYISPSFVSFLLIILAPNAAPTMKLLGLMSPHRNPKHSFLFRWNITAFLLKTIVLVLEIDLISTFCWKHIQGCTKRLFPGCVKLDEKLRFVYLLQAGERNFFTPFSYNLGSAF